MKTPRLYNKNQRGQAIVLIAALMVALIGALGLAIDGGGMYLLYRDVQNATDAAGLSAAYQMCTGGDPVAAIEESTSLNGFENGVDGVTITIQEPPGNVLEAGSPYIGLPGYIAIEIKAVKPSYFIQVVYNGPLEVTAVTVAQCRLAKDLDLMPNAGIITLKNDCSGPGITMADDTTLFLIGSAYTAAPVGCTGVQFFGDPQLIVHGGTVCSDGAINTDSGFLFGTQETPCSHDAPNSNDPLNLRGNEPYCDRSHDNGRLGDYAGMVLPAPTGYYSNFTTAPGEDVELRPGIYCSSSSINLQGKIETLPGGVTIFMDCTACTFETNPNTVNRLLPQNEGPYAGLLIYTPSTSLYPDGVQINGTTGSNMQGTVYAPSASCSVDGSNSTVINAQFICWDFTAADGELTMSHNPAAAFTPPTTFGITE